MTWQTPTAQDFRFGFEITMYVAARWTRRSRFLADRGGQSPAPPPS